MIVKKIKNKQTDKAKHWQIIDLVDYIVNPHDINPKEKIEHSGNKNFLCSTHSGRRMEMVALAQETVHSKMPVQHWVFSWPEGEQPTGKQVDELIDVFLKEMGLEDHQTVYGLHYNTENYHVHVAVNRVHPDTCKVIQPNKGFDIEVAHKIVALVEHKQGWASEKNARYIVQENGEVARRRTEKIIKPQPEATGFERNTGAKSAQRVIQEKAFQIFQTASSWKELHAQLDVVGISFEKKGSGAIVMLNEIAVKPSSIDRKFSMNHLIKKLGEYQPKEQKNVRYFTHTPTEHDVIKAQFISGNRLRKLSQCRLACYPAKGKKTEFKGILSYNARSHRRKFNTVRWNSYQIDPVSNINLDEWRTFISEIKAAEAQNNAAQFAEVIAKMKKRHAEERKFLTQSVAHNGLPILNVGRHFLAKLHKKELSDLKKQVFKPSAPRPLFEDWLRDKGLDEQADKWRYRNSLEPDQQLLMQKSERQDTEADMTPHALEDSLFKGYAAAVNADAYRVTCIRMEENGDKKTFILDKSEGVSKGFTHDELLRRMPEMTRLQRRGENIYYTPLSEHRHHILIDDMTRDSLARLKADGFLPTVVLESSPGNFQCVLTIPKLQSPHDRDVGNRITERLNKEYGDKKLSGCIHPHRAPGFGNLKPKHRQPDGSFPKVKLLSAEKVECGKAFELSQQIEQEYRNAEEQRKLAKPALTAAPDRRPGDPVSAYYAHLENIRQHLNMEDLSRVDAMIALRMRATGHSQDTVTGTLKKCAPDIREKPESRDWARYAERTAAYAFGVAGDLALAKNERYLEHWKKLEGIEPPSDTSAARRRLR